MAFAAAAAALGGRLELENTFHVLKEPSRSNGSSAALDGLVQRVWTSVSTAAQLPPSLLLLKIPLWLQT